MPLFFLLVTLEVKRELLIGELNSLSKALMPFFAALGGMLLPAVIYLLLNYSSDAIQGWAIPTATDIAFSLSVLMLLSAFVPKALRMFLMALAIIDDLGAIFIIVIFYSHDLNFIYLFLMVLATITLYFLTKTNRVRFTPYLLTGLALWFFCIHSGIHATISGVILGFFIPLRSHRTDFSPLKTLEHKLHPWIAFFILPLFAFVNTGISIQNINANVLFHPVTLGIFLGLFIGKQLGVFSACWLAQRLKLAKLPNNINGYHLYGLSILCGIGFTMSLFIGDLAFTGQKYLNEVKLGVISGSLLSGVVGAIFLYITHKARPKQHG